MREIKRLFEKHDGEFLKFERVENKKSKRPDLNAFILLDNLFTEEKNIISGACEGDVSINFKEEQMLLLSEDDIIELRRCGASYNSEFDCIEIYSGF